MSTVRVNYVNPADDPRKKKKRRRPPQPESTRAREACERW